MPSKKKVQESYWTPQVIEKTFRLDGDTTELLRKHFPSDWDINELNFIISEYLHKKNKQANKPETGKVRESLLKLAEVFEDLPTASYSLYQFKMKLKDGTLKKAFNEIIFMLENDEELIKDPNILSNAIREAVEEIPEKPPKGGSIPDYPERGLVADIAELYKKIHGEYPLRPTKFANARGTLDKIIEILYGILDGRRLVGLIRDYDTQLKEK